MISFVNLTLEHIRCFRVRKRGNVAECYLDNLAVRLESLRWGKGQGWRRFLVFAELTKSKKGAEYVALFTYFNFQSWIRVLLCSGPRQVINALTLYSIFNLELNPDDNSSIKATFEGFFDNIQYLYNESNQQAVILSVLFYVFFLWHYIPRHDGGLKGYCERKINKRLKSIVMVKVKKALAEEEERNRKKGIKAAMKNGEKPPIERQATLPQLGEFGDPDKLPGMPMLTRNDTMNTLPPYTSRPGTPMDSMPYDVKPPIPSRPGMGMHGSSTSISSNSSQAPFINRSASPAPSFTQPPAPFMNRTASPAPSFSAELNNFPPMRPGTANSNRSFAPRGPPQAGPIGNGGPMNMPRTGSPAIYSPDSLPAMPERALSPAAPNMDPYGSRPLPRQVAQLGGRPNYNGLQGPGGYPARSATNPNPTSVPMRQQFQPQRNMTSPPSNNFYGPQRNMTSPPPNNYYGEQQGGQYGFNYDVEAQRNNNNYRGY
ncbi:Potassium transporter [Diatrype stigma]|uniref:Potassium transporter n=1 Tax=Diatrype stigma TaxID=117547 RepID=A0AAN9YI15_9PEZI